MNFYRLPDVPADDCGLRVRQSPFAGAAMFLVFAAALIFSPIFLWQQDASWIAWGGMGLLAVLLMPMFLKDWLIRFRRSNWVLWIRPDGVWINFRSYQEWDPPDLPCVVHVDYDETAQAGQHVESYTTTDSDHSSIRHKITSLDLTLEGTDIAQLQTAFDAWRNAPRPDRRYLFGIVSSVGNPRHYSLSLPTPKTIRVAWRGGNGHWLSPSLNRALTYLDTYVQRALKKRIDHADWKDLTDEEFDAHIRFLVESGDTPAAQRLLTRRRGYTQTEAHCFVQELLEGN